MNRQEPISWLNLMHSLYRDKVFAMLAATPDLGIKQIAQLIPCSTNTARKWKRLFHEKEQDVKLNKADKL